MQVKIALPCNHIVDFYEFLFSIICTKISQFVPKNVPPKNPIFLVNQGRVSQQFEGYFRYHGVFNNRNDKDGHHL